jgi:hypothetical protein
VNVSTIDPGFCASVPAGKVIESVAATVNEDNVAI